MRLPHGMPCILMMRVQDNTDMCLHMPCCHCIICTNAKCDVWVVITHAMAP